MSIIQQLKLAVTHGYQVTREEALSLYSAPLEQLCTAADELRQHFCGNAFDLCTIINGKSGRCSENCKYCAQSSHYCTEIEEYALLDSECIVKEARYNESKGVLRYSIVTSGRNLSNAELDIICESYRALRDSCTILLCASHGLLSFEQFQQLKAAGVRRYHNNLETSRRFFPQICTTHTYDDKLRTIKNALAAGLEVCSGGIMGLGETAEDRIDMALDLRSLGIKSVPVNLLNPIKGTPLENAVRITGEEVRRITATYRFILPDANIRLAGGRGLLADKGRAVFQSGANAAISGDMLTTAGISISDDINILKELGFEAKLYE
ncbi:biotin synthase BioB [Sporomusa acidovorans]|uniref:Biotin synthase n=1 Tax=Sporomusa acidovorans (strain ATCC 49682 / DSM 3132 / Mol) TaxID=1123286 RepID=A0ABZ3J5H2_SPOA4|nr:biotin synthase BioB [Sporomusa acidovorans]OZC15382.1 biotin synthase [Sporomusa acidovorans DSM 3132]SDF13744.1 biotin synthase [Sporomusa acidovorans]